MFNLDSKTVKLTSFNPRAELHGEDQKPAADLTLQAKLANDCLAEFHPTLKSLLYMKDEEQKDLVSDADPHHMTRRRFTKMGDFKWDDEIVGAEVTVHYGTGGKSDIKLGGCLVNGFKFSPEEGGTVVLTFRVQCHPDEKQAGKLCMLVGNEVPMTVTPPEPGEDDPQ